MATSIASINGGPGNDAFFRLYCNGIHTAIVAVGWVQTLDAGQINFATVTRPLAPTTVAGFAIYRMNDTLQATSPVFLKVSYGTGSTATNTRTTVQVASATDNSGVLKGVISASLTMSGNGSWSGSPTCYFSGSSNRLSFCLWPGIANQAGFCIVERDLDANGAVTGAGVNFIVFQGSTATISEFLSFPGPPWISEAKINALLSTQATQTSNSIAEVSVVRTYAGVLRNPITSLLACAANDFTSEVTSTVSLYGTDHTYLAMTAAVWGTTFVGNSTGYGFLMLFE